MQSTRGRRKDAKKPLRRKDSVTGSGRGRGAPGSSRDGGGEGSETMGDEQVGAGPSRGRKRSSAKQMLDAPSVASDDRSSVNNNIDSSLPKGSVQGGQSRLKQRRDSKTNRKNQLQTANQSSGPKTGQKFKSKKDSVELGSEKLGDASLQQRRKNLIASSGGNIKHHSAHFAGQRGGPQSYLMRGPGSFSAQEESKGTAGVSAMLMKKPSGAHPYSLKDEDDEEDGDGVEYVAQISDDDSSSPITSKPNDSNDADSTLRVQQKNEISLAAVNVMQLNPSQVSVLPATQQASSDFERPRSRNNDSSLSKNSAQADLEARQKTQAPTSPKVSTQGKQFESPKKIGSKTEMSGSAAKARGSAAEVASALWRQIDELKALDKVFPDPGRTVGCYVQMPQQEPGQQQFGLIKECTTGDSSPVSIADHKLLVKPAANSSATAKTYAANTVKYLARAYLCSLTELATEKMPQSLLEALNVTDATSAAAQGEPDSGVTEGTQVVLIQTISTKVQQQVAQSTAVDKKEDQAMQDNSQAAVVEQSCFSEGNSAHRLHALVSRPSKGNNSTEQDAVGHFSLYPVVFRPSQTRNRKVKVPLSLEAPSDEISQAQEIASLCFKDKIVGQKSLDTARLLQKAFVDNYLSKISRVLLTKDNMKDLVLSIVSFKNGEEGDNQDRDSTSVGIVTNYTTDSENEVLLFVSLFISSKPGRTTAWVPLSQTKVYADLSLGLVSQKWLEKLHIHDSDASSGKHQPGKVAGRSLALTSTPARNAGVHPANKLRQLQMLNWQESMAEKRKMLLLEDLGLAATLSNEEEASSVVGGWSRKVIRRATATSDTRVSNCRRCQYIVKESNPQYSVLMCSRCNRKTHEWCLDPQQVNISSAEKNWRCPDCLRCSNCKSSQCMDQMLTCYKCNTPTHYDCLPPSYRASLRPLYTVTADPENERLEVRKLNLLTKRFRCQDCIKCQNCDSTSADGQLSTSTAVQTISNANRKQHTSKWSKDFKLCAKCNKMRDKRLFCPVCERFQPCETAASTAAAAEETAIVAATNKSVASSTKQQQNLIAIGQQIVKGEKMIKCRGCQMLVHVDCDRMLADPITRRQIMPERIEGEQVKLNANAPWYKCPNCRRQNRNSILEQIIQVLSASDKQDHFMHPFWKQMQPQAQQEYFDIIKRDPVCFSRIQANIRANKRYLTNPEHFWTDLSSVFVNAKAYNDSPEIYNQATQLHEKANAFLKNRKLVEVVEINSRATRDENQFTLQMRNIAKDLRKGIVPSGSKRPKAAAGFKVTAKEMLQGSEVPDLRIFGIPSTILDGISQTSGSVSQDGPGPAIHSMFQLANVENLHSQVAKKSKLPAHKQWEKLMEDLATNDERDTCWYPNPIKISFEDPALIFEEMCYLCGAFGNHDDFLSCNLCAESFHPYCLPYPKNGRAQFQDYWRCYNCMFCEKCHSSKQWEGLLICAICDKVDHFWCLEPQLIQVPECNWKCPECFKCAKCATKSFFSDKDIENKVNLDPNEKFVLSYDFELCYQCGQDEYRKSYCSICNEKTGFGLNSVQGNSIQKVLAIDSGEVPADAGLLKCNQCGLYSHLTCSKTDMQSLERHAATFNRFIKEDTGVVGTETAKSIYKCIDCLLVDRLPSFYIFHQCELYESLHQSMQRQALLSSLVETVLAKYLNVADPSLYVNNFIQHHQKVFREDRLIQQWLALLDSAPASQNLDAVSTDMSMVIESQQPATETIEEQKKEKTDTVDVEMAQESKPEESKALAEATVSNEVDTDYNHQHFNCFQKVNAIQEDSSVDQPSQKTQVYQDLYGHKTGFLPVRRDLYENLLRKENNRVGRKDFFEELEDIPDKMTVPTDDAISAVDLSELFVKIELRAVLKIRLLFMQWAQSLVHNTVVEFKQQFAAIESAPADAVDSATRIKNPTTQIIQTGDAQPATMSEPDPVASQIEFCQEEDVLIRNPQELLKCLLCGLNGERAITGRLIPFQINQFVHVNCAMWTQEVQEGQEENDATRELYNFFFAYNEFKHYACDFCGEGGATIFCSNRGQKRCPAAFHFPCAYSSRKVAFLPNTDIYCEQCIPKTPEATPGFPIEFRNYPKRRIIIVRNIEPQCTMAFQNQIRKSNLAATAQQQAATASGMPPSKQKSLTLENEHSIDSTAQMPTSLNLQQSTTSGPAGETAGGAMATSQQNGQDVGVIIACNKWRPYYYDMYNRVGNMTLLSLSRGRNSIIESLHTFTHENRHWHERFNLRFPEEEQSDFASIRIYWRYGQKVKDSQQDVKMIDTSDKRGPPTEKAYYLFSGNKVSSVGRHDFSKVKRYINRRLDEYQGAFMAKATQKPQLSLVSQQRVTIEQFWLQQIGNLSLRYPLFCQDNTFQTSKVMSGLEKFPIQYWNNPGEKLGDAKQGGLELKDLKVAGFFFKSGYKALEAQKIGKGGNTGHARRDSGPQQISATPTPAQQDMSRQQNRRGADQSTTVGAAGMHSGWQGQTMSHGGMHDLVSSQAAATQPGGSSTQQASSGAAQQAGASPAKNTSLESIFKQILEANQVNDQKASRLIVSLATSNNAKDQNDEDESSDDDSTARRKDLSTKVMNYEQIMACLGKQTLKVKQAKRRKAEEEKAYRQEQLKQQQQMQMDALQWYQNPMYPAGADGVKAIPGSEGDDLNKDGQQTAGNAGGEPGTGPGRRKGSRLSDLNELTNKGNDINAAMKYRAAKERPKQVEVWISKIHRNGLFAIQPLNPKDIVIEYVGEKIRDPVADKREITYAKLGVGDCYNFRLNKDYIIDATNYGSKARYINHSCEPNLNAEYLNVNGETHIIFVAARKIRPQEELTFDYNFMPEIESIECFCGSEKCRGRLA